MIAAEGLAHKQSKDLAWSLENRPIEFMFVPRLVDIAGPRVSFRSVEGLSLMRVDLPQFTGGKLAVKRAFDIAVSTVALVFLAPLFMVVAVLIKLDDGGPVFFKQKRVGRFGQPFTIHKFRTMCLDAESKIDALIEANGGAALLFKLEDDPRITKIGKVLRKYSIDELPQFWTVLRGGMSVVGPRPQVEREVAEYSDVHHRRLLIKPGITGLWQVGGRSELSMAAAIQLDLRYVENWSVLGDINIVAKTVGVVLRPDGAY
ncbi:sugar transferase [Micropruina sp.]|uniref:sugar transferase n=1 Tax=Micropruina sp. TaxID=2737536 RepID=UPI0039E3FD14